MRHRLSTILLIAICVFAFLISNVPLGFCTTETRYMRNALTANKQFATNYNIIRGSLSSGALSNLQASDNVYMVFASALVSGLHTIEVEFNGSISGHMPFLQVQVENHVSVSQSYGVSEIRAYNYQTGAYETTGSMVATLGTSTADTTKYMYNLLGNKGKYVSSTGEWKVKIKFQAISEGSAFTVSLDYLHFRSVSFQLGTSQTTSYSSGDADVAGLSVGIRVWGVKSDDTEEEITSGTIVATVTGPDSTTTLSATWNCPSTTQYVAYFIIVYCTTDFLKTAALASGGLPLIFMTEDLNASLSSATWTVYYAFYYSATADQTFFRFGTSTYNSRITNFSWSSTPTKSWYSITWNFALATKQWHIITWMFNLATKQWHSITWILELLTKSWHHIQWNFILDASTKQWHSIVWFLTLGKPSYTIYIVGILFFFLIALILIAYLTK